MVRLSRSASCLRDGTSNSIHHPPRYGAGFFALQSLQRVRPYPYTPQQLPAACVASYGLQAAFLRLCPAGWNRPQKNKTSVKTICRLLELFYCLGVSLYSNTIKLRISAHRTPNRAQSNPGPLRQEQAGALSFVLGQGEDGTMLFIGVPPGAAGAVTTPADILHAGHLAVGLELNHASFQRCGQIGHGV